MAKEHPGTVDGYIHLRELWFRLNIHQASWDHHVDAMGRVPRNLIVRAKSPKVVNGFKHPKGQYVKWPLAAEMLMNVFQDVQLAHTYIRLEALGFTRDLKIADKEVGCTRISGMDIMDWKACVKEEGGSTDTIPRAFKNGNIGTNSKMDTGVITDTYLDIIPKPVPKPNKKQKADIEKTLDQISMDDSVDIDEMIGDIREIDFTDPDEVAEYQRKAKFFKELTAMRKEAVKLAKESNSSVDIDEIEKMLEATMLAFRTTISQAVPAITREIHGAIVTELVRHDPTLQRKLAKLDITDLDNSVRAVFDKAAYELSELLRKFQ